MITVVLTPWRGVLLALVLVAVLVTLWARNEDKQDWFGGIYAFFFAILSWCAVLLWAVSGWLA